MDGIDPNTYGSLCCTSIQTYIYRYMHTRDINAIPSFLITHDPHLRFLELADHVTR